MRDYVGVPYSTLPAADKPDFQNRLRSMLGDIDYFLRDLNRGIARIQQGEIPDGSGTPIGTGGTLTDYWFKPGISDPFKAFMSTGDSAGGIISSTSSQTKGFIDFGESAVPIVRMDETLGFTGINVAAPAAQLHINAPSTPTIVSPISDQPTVPNSWTNQSGTLTVTDGTVGAGAVSDNDDATYVTEINGSPGTEFIERMWNNGNNPVTSSHTVTVVIRHRATAGQGGTERMRFVITRGATTVADYTRSIQSPSSFHDYEVTLTTVERDLLIGISDTHLDIFAVGGVTESFDISKVYFELSTGAGGPIARWDVVDVQSGEIDENGLMGVGTAGDALGARFTAESSTATEVTEIIKGATSQTSNLTQWQNQAGTVLSFIDSSGAFNGPAVLTPVTVTDSTFTVLDNADPTKTFKFELGGSSAGVDVILATSSTTDQTITLPNGTGTLGSLAVAGTWTALQTFRDTTFKLVDDGDATKTAVFSLGGASANADLTLAWAGTADRTVTLPDQTGTVPTLENANTVTGAWVFGEGPPAVAQTFFVNSGGSFVGTGPILDDTTGFKLEIQGPTSGFTADRFAAFPDGSGTILISGVSGALNGNINSVLNSSTASSGASFQDVNTTSKKMRFVLSGAVGNNSITITSTASRNYGLGNLSGNLAIVGDDAPAVASGALGKVDLTAQVANIGATNLSSTPPAGFYDVEVYLMTTTSDVTAGTLAVVIGWTDNVGATTNTVIAAHSLAATGRSTGRAIIRVNSADITYSVTVTGAYGTSAYAVYVRVVSLG